jgi:cobalt-zinc-cadmium efflux system membrane fusion protein
MRFTFDACARLFQAVLLAAVLAVVPSHVTLAHEGHSHDDPKAAGAAESASPRVVATSETYQLVGIVEGEVLVIYLDRAADNAPVTGAELEVSLNGETFKAEAMKNGTYEVTAPVLKRPGEIEVLVTVGGSVTPDLLVGALKLGANGASNGTQSGSWVRWFEAIAGSAGASRDGGAGVLASLLLVAGTIGGLGLAVWASGRIRHRRVKSIVLLAGLLSLAVYTAAVAHEGHDHGADLKASPGNNPQRRADGTIFVPKPTQRLLEVRTTTLATQEAVRTVRLQGRVAANPNFTGFVQSTIPGRYEAPATGVPPLGTHIKAGDLMGRVAPSFASVDASDMAQTLGDIEQKLSIARSKLARQEHLLRTNVIATALVDETRLEVDGLIKRRNDLLAARVRPEELRAPVDGVIAISRVVAGQVVSQSDKLFEIIDPSRVMVEALIFDQVNPDAVTEAKATAGDVTANLRLLGRSRSLQQQYALMQFEVLDNATALNVGMPVTVIAHTGAPVSGLFVPRAAIAQAPNGQSVVFEHREPEVFVPRPIRTEAFDANTLLVTGGLEQGVKIVVKNAPLLNQVR